MNKKLVRIGCSIIATLVAAQGFAADGEIPSLNESLFSRAVAEAQEMPRLHSLLVSHGGELVIEEYFNGRSPQRPANVKSVSKSIMSALVGIAIDQGHIESLDQPISDYYAERLNGDPTGYKQRITIGNLLSMQAGLETTSFYNFGAWVLSDDWVGFALDRWTRDPNGVYFGGNNMELTPRQMLAFGEMYMNGGQANGRQIVPREWVETSLHPKVRSRRNTDRQYGYGWWMLDMAGVPTTYAWGFGGQFILLAKDLDMVVVTTSSSEPGDTRRAHTRALYDLLEEQIIAPAAQSRSLGTD